MVHQVQQFAGNGNHIRLIVMIAAAPAGDVLVGHGKKVHVLHLQPAKVGGLSKPKDILEGQVRLHIFLEHPCKLIDLGDILQLQKLLHHGGQKCLLGFDPAQVPIRISQCHAVFPVVMAVTQHLHGVVAGEETVTFFLVDVEILIGVVVVHIPGHVKPHAAHGVYNLAYGVPLHDHLVIRFKAHQLGDFLIEVFNALVPTTAIVVHSVDPLDVIGNVHHRIPGDGHHRGLLVGHVVACQQHGVGISAAAGIPAQNQHGIIILTFSLPVAAGTHTVAIIQFLNLLSLLCRLFVVQVRTNKQCLVSGHPCQGHRENHRHRHQTLLLPAQAALLGFLRLLLRRMLSMFSLHDVSILSKHPAPLS